MALLLNKPGKTVNRKQNVLVYKCLYTHTITSRDFLTEDKGMI